LCLTGLKRPIGGGPCSEAAAYTFREAPWRTGWVSIRLENNLVVLDRLVKPREERSGLRRNDSDLRFFTGKSLLDRPAVSLVSAGAKRLSYEEVFGAGIPVTQSEQGLAPRVHQSVHDAELLVESLVPCLSTFPQRRAASGTPGARRVL